MARAPKVSSFFRLSARHRRMALEAGWELLRARLDTVRPASHYTRHFGTLGAEPAEAAPEQELLAAEIGAVVERVAARLPFRALCLQQALATRRMLRRRGVPATVFLGLLRDPAARQGGGADDRAHAWVQSGSRVVSGDRDLDRFAVVGAFS